MLGIGSYRSIFRGRGPSAGLFMVLLAAAAIVLVATSGPAWAAHPSWFDDFNDGNATDGIGPPPAGNIPLVWDLNPMTALGAAPFTGIYDESSGDLLMEGTDSQDVFGFFGNDDEVLVADMPGVQFTNGVSARTRARVTDLGGIGLVVNGNSFVLTDYYAVYHFERDGNGDLAASIEVSRFDGGSETELVDIGYKPDPNNPGAPGILPAGQDVIIQVDMYNGVQTFSWWNADQPQPEPSTQFVDPIGGVDGSTPSDADILTIMGDQAVSIEDPSFLYQSGTVALVFNENSVTLDSDPGNPDAEQGTGLVRWVKASEVRIVDGDMDLDGDSDFDDIVGFVQAISNPDGYLADAGQLAVIQGDTDYDGDNDFDDIPRFVALLGGSLSAAQAAPVPEPSTLLLAIVGLVGLVTCSVGRRRHGA